MLEKFNKYFPITFVTGILISIGTWLYTRGGNDVKLEQRIYPTVELRNKSIRHLEVVPTPQQIAKKAILDSLNTVSAIKSRRLRDSLIKKQAKRDSLTAVTIYQMKEEIKALKK
jgi:hypothetical protein